MAPEVKTAKNSKLPKLPENCFEPVGKGGWPPISTWIKDSGSFPILCSKGMKCDEGETPEASKSGVNPHH
jgi:hypothetical protein